MTSINYSIIIPHKNIPKLLQRCLDSIPRREDIQIIVVDDNSDENKVNFERFPGLNDKFVEVYFTKEGKGAGYARNVGLQHAKGKWLLFADADDFFNRIFLKTIDSYCESNYDIIYFGVNSVYSDSLKEASRGNFVNTYIEKDLRINAGFELSRFKRYAPWAKMIKKDFVNKYSIQFEERHVSNDIWFSILTGFYAKNVYADISPIYCLSIRSGSLEMTINKENFDERFDAACKVNSFLFKHDKSRCRINLWHYSYFYLHVNLKSYIHIIKKIWTSYKEHNKRKLYTMDMFCALYDNIIDYLKFYSKII